MLLATTVSAQNNIRYADYDLAGSGFVTPAGMPAMGMPSPGMMGPQSIMPVGYSACDSGCCDSGMGGCASGCCGTGGCGAGGCGPLGCGGVLGKMRQGGGPPCLFCQGSGCTACRELPFGYAGSMLAGLFETLSPYDGAELCQQRWYDLSVEALVLDRNIGGSVPAVFTRNGTGPNAPAVLTLGSLDSSDLEGGVRISGAFLFGVGGNLETTYMGANEWDSSATATSSTASLYSFISDFGVTPNTGFDDTDRSLSQSVRSESEFHSAEFNYRRRTMFPYCRFQSSWLVGLRYMRYDDALTFAANGLNNNGGANNGARYFGSSSFAKNKLFGVQSGFDFWWNVRPGISVGFGAKGGWLQNDVDRSTAIASNSLGPGATPGNRFRFDGDQRGTIMTEFELKGVYRFTYSLSLRGSYYLLNIDDIAFGGIDSQASLFNLVNGGGTLPTRSFVYDDLDLAGFTGGIEYLW